MGGRTRSVVGAVGLIVALTVGAFPGGAHAAVKVLSNDQNVLTRFGALDCKVKRVNGAKRFTAKAREGGWRINAVIFPGEFDGFHGYKVMYGGDSPADVLTGSNSRLFANYNKPDLGPGGPELTVAGGIRFPNKHRKRRVLWIGLPIIYDNPAGGNWVSVAGQARCNY